MNQNEGNYQYYYKIDETNKTQNKNRFTNIKSNSPVLSHLENNYFYNTKINHLILQGPSNSNRGPNVYQQTNPLFNSVYINYDILNKNSNNISNMYQKKYQINSNSLNKDNKKIIGLDNYMNNRNINSKSFFEEKSDNNNIINNDNINININNNIKEYYNSNNNKNNYNPFQVLNYLKKRKSPNNKNNNNNNLTTKELDIHNKSKNDNNNINFSKSNLSTSGIFQNRNNTRKIQTHKNNNNNNNNYYDKQNNINNINKNIKSSRNSDLNNTNGYRRIPLKKDKIGKYHIKSPGEVNSKRNTNKNEKSNKIIIGKKNTFKSPEILGKKTKYESLRTSKYNDLNKISNEFNSEMGLYKKNNDISKNTINISNSILKNNTILNNNIKTSTINNITRFHIKNKINNGNKNNKICNNYCTPTLEDNILLVDDNKINTQNEIYIKINQKKSKLFDLKTNNNKNNESPINNKLLGNKTNNKLDYNKYKDNIELSCDILEQFYYNSFKNCFSYFIQKMISFVHQKISKRSVILKRIKGVQKLNNESNILKNSYSSRAYLNLNLNNNNYNINKEINDPRKKDKSPTKFVELQNNIMPSMMKINQDNYIEMFNELFKRSNESFDDKKCRSPIIEKRIFGDNINLFKDSFDLENTNHKDNVYDKYKTNTNINLYLPKNNNLQVYNNLANKNNYYCEKKIKNIELQKAIYRASLSTDNKKNFVNINSQIKSKKYININNIKRCKINNDSGKENYTYNDSKIYQNQKYRINDSPEPYFMENFNGENSCKREYDKVIKTQGNKNKILYSKPVLKKSITKDSDITNKRNNMNIINLRKNERNNQGYNNNINIFHSHNMIRVNQNINRNPNDYSNQKSIFNNLNYKEEIKNYINNENNKYNEMIIKNVGTKDKRIHVFIKYVYSGNISTKNNNRKPYKKLFYNRTDSITIFNISNKDKRYNNRSFVFGNYFNNNENEFDNIIIEKKRLKKYDSERKFNNYKYKNNEINKESKKVNNIIDKDSLSNTLTINKNSNFTIEENIKINEDIKNSIIYLINFLENMFNDNKKLILFNFFKNLKKIKTNALYYTSKKRREQNKLKNTNVINTQRYNNKNIIEINNFNNYKNLNSNRSVDSKIINNTASNAKIDIKKSFNTKIITKKIDYSLTEEIFQDNSNTNKKNANNINRHQYNTSFNKNNNNLSNIINNSIFNEKKDMKDIKLEDNFKSKEDTIKMKKNENEDKNNDTNKKNKIKEMKLAKLGKIFKNLEQENNIISAIKEQFLEWSNKNNMELGKSDNKEKEDNNNIRKNKKYGIKTFDMEFMFKNELNGDSNKKKKENDKNEEFQEILKNFRKKLIGFSLKNKILKNNVNKSENEYEREKIEVNNYEDYDDDTQKNKSLKNEKDFDSQNNKNNLEADELKDGNEDQDEK